MKRCALVLAAFIELPCAALGQEPSARAQGSPPRFGVRVDAVRLDVFVGRHDQPVRGLTASDFEVLDNGVRQKVDLLGNELVRLDAMIVLDTSASVQGKRMDHLRTAANAFMQGLAERDRVGILTFFHHLELVSPLCSPKTARDALSRVSAGGGTSLHDAMFAGMKLIEASGERQMLLVFTDGVDQHSRLGEEDLLRAAKRSPAVIYSVGVAPSTSVHTTYLGERETIAESYSGTRFLRQLADLSGGRFLAAGSSEGLEETFLSILQEMRDRYVLSYLPSGVDSEGWHRLEVKLKRGKGEVRVRRGYFVLPDRGR